MAITSSVSSAIKSLPSKGALSKAMSKHCVKRRIFKYSTTNLKYLAYVQNAKAHVDYTIEILIFDIMNDSMDE